MSTKATIFAGFVASSAAALLAVGAGAQGVEAEARQCFVQVDRSGDSGLYNVVRQEFTDGTCTCFVTTGPEGQGASVENRISSLFRERTCVNDPAVTIPSENPAFAAGAGAGGGNGLGVLVGLLAAGAAGGGLAAAIDGGDQDLEPLSP